MTISGPQPINVPLQPADQPAITLRVNQRITAQVLGVSGDQVELALQGTRIVATVDSESVASGLIDKRNAQFIVKNMENNTLQLQVVPSSTPAPELQLPMVDLIKNILTQAGIEQNNLTMQIAKALVDSNLPVSPQLVAELSQLVEQLGVFNEADLQIAVALKKAGLPISPEIIDLMKQQPLQLGQSIDSIIEQLSRMLNSSRNPNLANALQENISLLQNLKLDWTVSKDEIARQLQQIIRTLGKPVEHSLGQQIQESGRGVEQNLLSLAQLRATIIANGGPQSLANEIQQVMDGLRQMQFQNSPPITTPDGGQWLTMQIPIAVDPQSRQNRDQQSPTGNIRISYKKKGSGREIDEGHTRMVIEVDVREKEVLAVDLTVAEKLVGAMITASNANLQELAKEELPLFEEGLKELGFDIAAMRTGVGDHSLENTPKPNEVRFYDPKPRGLNLEA